MASIKEKVRFTGTLRGQGHEATCSVLATKVSMTNSGPVAYANYMVNSVSTPLPEGLYELSVNGSLIRLAWPRPLSRLRGKSRIGRIQLKT